MTATIFVWRPSSRTVGHGSMALTDGTYISWWPTGDVRDSPAQTFGLKIDEYEEGNSKNRFRLPDYASAPITELDEDRISAWWQRISGRDPHDTPRSRHEPKPAVGRFQLFSGANCSNMVARALVLGGIETKYPVAATILADQLLMTPLTLIDIAEAITGSTADKAVAVAKNLDHGLTKTVWQYVVGRMAESFADQ